MGWLARNGTDAKRRPDAHADEVARRHGAGEAVEAVVLHERARGRVRGEDAQGLLLAEAHDLARFEFSDVPEVVRLGEEETLRVVTSHAATRSLVRSDLHDGLSCPVTPRDYVSIRIDSNACIGCGNCEMVCETQAFWAQGEKAEVRKLSNYECTRDHACARNCPTGAIHLGNL